MGMRPLLGRGLAPRRSSGSTIRHNRGFTLMEVMVVVVIVGIMISFAVLSIGNPGAGQLEKEARRLAALVELAGEESILQAQELGLKLDSDSYSFLAYNGERWVPLEQDNLLKPRQLPDGMRLELDVEGKPLFGLDESDEEKQDSAREADLPQVFLLSSGEITPPFEVSLYDIDTHTAYRLKGSPTGVLTFTGPEDL